MRLRPTAVLVGLAVGWGLRYLWESGPRLDRDTRDEWEEVPVAGGGRVFVAPPGTPPPPDSLAAYRATRVKPLPEFETAQIACPVCGAPAGYPCNDQAEGQARPQIHSLRLVHARDHGLGHQ